jgi:hypothetical protein
MCFQSFFMLMTHQPLALASSYSTRVKVPTLVSEDHLRDRMRTRVGIIVQDQHHQPRTVARLGPLQHR